MLDPVLRDDIDRITKSLEPELIEFRRRLHRHPELGRQEHQTTAAIVARLTAAGLSSRVLASGTGVVCDVRGPDGTAPTLGFRGDIDALPLVDDKRVRYRSQVEGVCHACGHDAHTSIVLGAALALAELAEQGVPFRSTRLIFQPAEEVTPGGALDVIADDGIQGLERVFAVHCDPKIQVGDVGFRAGPITAGADRIRVTVKGPGGHTARPHLTSDLVYALSKVVTELPAVLSRLADPRAGLSVVWGQVHAGAVANTIPQTGYAEGTMRCLDARAWASAHERVPDLVRSLAAPYGVDIQVELHTSVPPCVNDEQETAWMRAVALDLLGAGHVVGTDQSLGGEDFGWILGRVPGALARLGVRSHEVADAGDLHRGSFDIDESAIAVGVRLFCAMSVAPSGS